MTDIRAVYTTVTDACTPPQTVTLDVDAKVLTVSGGAGGDLNSFTGYGVSWRLRLVNGDAWGEWSADTVIAGTTFGVAAPAGYEMQFRARTLGSAGEAYYSGYVVCETTLTGNAAPGVPVITLPGASAQTYCARPVIVLNCPAEPDGNAQDLLRSLDGGAWAVVVYNVPVAGGVVYDRLPVLGEGWHTAAYRMADPYDFGPEASVGFTVKALSWAREIAAGTVIANASVSHRADIAELLAAVNHQRAYYGLAALTLPGTVGAFGDWKSQMEALQAGIAAAEAAAGQESAAWLSVPGYPTAAVVNELRARVATA